MRLTIGGVLIGVAVIAASFWVTLAVLDYFAAPPSPVASGSTATPSAPVATPAPRPPVTTPAPSPPVAARQPNPPVVAPAPTWNEALYLAVNADVAAAVARKEFKSGREHYELAGRAERRQGGFVPSDWDEGQYLRVNQDVAAAVAAGSFLSGYHHYLAAGRAEGRRGGVPSGRPPDK